MKILIINDSVGIGSVGKIVVSLYNHFIKNGNVCKIAYARDNSSQVNADDLFCFSNRSSLYANYLKATLFGHEGSYAKKQTEKLIDFIMEFKPDIVNIHSLYGYYLNIEILLSFLAKYDFNVFLTLHSCWDFTGHCCYYTFNNCQKWIFDKCADCGNYKTYPKSLFKENTQRNFLEKEKLYSSLRRCTLICPSGWMEHEARQSHLKNKNIVTIHNGIELQKFSIDSSVEKYNKPTILCPCRPSRPRHQCLPKHACRMT